LKLTFVEAASFIQPVFDHVNFVDKIGKIYGKLKVLFYTGQQKAGKYTVASFACQCDCGNYTIVSTSNLREGKSLTSCGCSRNTTKEYVTPQLVNSRINDLENLTGYKVIDTGKRGSWRDRWTLSCEKHGSFKAVFGNLIQDLARCPHCKPPPSGFNRGRGGYFYLNRLIDETGKVRAIKFGITNCKVEKRISSMQLCTVFHIENIYRHYFKNGQDAFDMETLFGKEHGNRFLSKDLLTTGYTETVSPDFGQKYISWAKAHTNSKVNI